MTTSNKSSARRSKFWRGDVFEGLPSGPEIDAVADLDVAGDGGDLRIGEVRDEAGDGVFGDDAVGVDADVDLFVHAFEGVVEGVGLAAVGLGEDGEAAGGDVVGIGGTIATSTGAVLWSRRR